jgi:hypothetical protein
LFNDDIVYNFHASKQSFIFLSENFKMKWVLKPPDEMRAQDPFNVTYFLQVQPGFYDWAVKNGHFTGVGPGDLE